MSSSSPTSFYERRYKVMTKGIDVISSSDSESDDDRACKPRVLLADQFRSNSTHRFRRRAEKVWAREEKVWDREEKEDESQKLIPEEKVGDIVHLGRTNYFIIDIFEKEIMELGDRVDLNFKRFNKFEVVHGDAPRDHHFYNSRCCYSSGCCVCVSETVEKEWGILERNLASREKGVRFFVRTYKERKELMRVVVIVTKGDHQSHSLFFFDLKFPTEYPNRAPSFFYHPYGLPLSTPESVKPLRQKLYYNILDVFLHIQELVLMNTNMSCHQMLDILKRPLTGFEDFVIGHFRKKGALILQKTMEEMDMEKERDRNMFWKMYIAFEDNKAYCEHLLNSELKEELKRFKEKEYSLSDHYSSSSTYFPTVISRFDDVRQTTKSQNFWNKLSFLL